MYVVTEWKLGTCHAWLRDRPEIKGSGKSADAAIGNMIMAHQGVFRFSIEFKPKT